MNEQIFFDYLIGEWLVERKIIYKLSSSFSAVAFGRASIIKKNKNTLNYRELLKVKWANAFISNAHKQYDYVLDNAGKLGLYNYDHDGMSFMFNLGFEPNLGNIIKGQYQCVQDFYYTTYEIINYDQFVLTFKVNGPKKDYSIVSSFTRGGEV